MTSTSRIEYGLRLDCEKNNCIELYGAAHEDDGRVFITNKEPEKAWKFNGHETSKVVREVTVIETEWVVIKTE